MVKAKITKHGKQSCYCDKGDEKEEEVAVLNNNKMVNIVRCGSHRAYAYYIVICTYSSGIHRAYKIEWMHCIY